MKKLSGGKPGLGKVAGAMLQAVPWIAWCSRKPVFAPLFAVKK
jgi:hypothetical protein